MILSLVLFIVAKHVLPYAILQPGRVHLDSEPTSFSENFDRISIPITEADSIRGFLFKPVNDAPKAIIILIHGIGGAKEHFFPLAAKLTHNGYGAIALDNRAHGESDGQFVTYGFKEKADISRIVKYLKLKYPFTKVGVWGSSMGGAIALQALETDTDIDFGIVESTFTTLEQIVYDYQKRYSGGIGLRFLTDYVLDQAGKIAQFDPKQVSPINSVKNISQPIFLAHGDQDKRITYRYGEQLFENLASKDKTFTLIKGAGHLNVGKVGADEYYTSVLVFINRQLTISDI